VIDPLEGFNPRSETTLFLMREAQKRGHRLFVFTLSDFHQRNHFLYGEGLEIKILERSRIPFYKVLRQTRVKLEELDVLFLRKDPPFDLTYLHHLYLLQGLRGKVFMMNDPLGILSTPEKIGIFDFPSHIPPTCVTQSFPRMNDFAKAHPQGIVIKPLHLSGGRNVFRFKSTDSNLKVAFDLLSQNGKDYVMGQAYLPVDRTGDKRIILLNGKILGSFLRMPKKGEHRANLHSGGSFKACRITLKETKIAREVGEALLKRGLYFIGLDLIDEHLTEVNVTSPMGINEINQTENRHCEKQVIDFVESCL